MRAGKRLEYWAVLLLFAFYMYALFKIIVLKFGRADVMLLWEQLQRNVNHPEYIVARLQAGNLIPLKEIARALETLSGHSLTNLLGNIVIFIPFGIFLGALAKSGKLTLTGAYCRSLAVSLGLECAQVLFSIGTFDVDDLILNSIGGSVGFIAYALGVWLTSAATGVPSGKPAR